MILPLTLTKEISFWRLRNSHARANTTSNNLPSTYLTWKAKVESLWITCSRSWNFSRNLSEFMAEVRLSKTNFWNSTNVKRTLSLRFSKMTLLSWRSLSWQKLKPKCRLKNCFAKKKKLLRRPKTQTWRSKKVTKMKKSTYSKLLDLLLPVQVLNSQVRSIWVFPKWTQIMIRRKTSLINIKRLLRSICKCSEKKSQNP